MSTQTAVAPVKVGDFFVSHWGWDQTNIDFAKVVALTPKGVKIQAWTSKVVQDRGCQVQVVPGDLPVRGGWVRTADGSVYDREVEAPVEIKRLQVLSGYSRPHLARNSYSSWALWDGQPESETGRGYGH
ncbi:MAG: hypothetical protein NVS3B1_17680 [Marmoricola sp.]